jgi:plastocyanin
VAVAGCSDDDEDGGEPAATDDDVGTAEEVSVEAADFSFSPAEVTVPAGIVTVKLANSGQAPHTLTVYADEEFSEAVEGADTENVSAGEEGGFTVAFEAGEYFFRCELHPGQMQGTLTAE